MDKQRTRIEYRVEAEAEGKMLQKYLEVNKGLSAKAVKKLKHQGAVFLNGRRTLLNVPVKAGDHVLLVYPPQTTSPYLAAEPIPLEILYEDAQVMVVVKQPNLCVHPTKGYPGGTLANGILYHWQKRGEQAHLHLVNRLDKDTSGLVLIAKNAFAAQQLFRQQGEGKIQRAYLALALGWLEKDQGTLDLPTARVPGRTIRRVVSPEGQRAVTKYRVLARCIDPGEQQAYTYLTLELETGRTHQIRVHLSHLGHPLVGDELYGREAGPVLQRQFLHAHFLSFIHPLTGERLEMHSELPQDLEGFLAKLKVID